MVLISSCGIFRHVKKDKQSINSDSSFYKSGWSVYTDTGKTITREIIDTIAVSPELKVIKNFKLKPLPEGLTFPGFVDALAHLDTAMVSLSLDYDTLQNSIRVIVNKRKEILPVKADRTIIVLNGISAIQKSNEATRVINERTTNNKDIKPDVRWMWFLTGLLILIAIVLFIFYRKRS